MGLPEDVIDYLRTVKGVTDVMELNDEMSSEIQTIEKSVRTKTNHEYQNVGYDIALKRKHRVCVFFVGGYLFEKRTILKLMTSDGTVMGTSLMADQIDEYKQKDDVIWISEDFVVFPNIIGHGEEAFVLYPFDIPEIEEAVPGCKNVIGVSPTPSTDAYLKDKAGVPITKSIFTSIIAYDE